MQPEIPLTAHHNIKLVRNRSERSLECTDKKDTILARNNNFSNGQIIMARTVFSWIILGAVIMGRSNAAAISDDSEIAPNAEETRDVGQPNLWIGGIIPYEISSVFSLQEADIIKKAMRDIQRKSCVRFRERETGDQSSIIFDNIRLRAGCFAFFGHQLPSKLVNINRHLMGSSHTKQLVNLESSCLSYGQVLHEIMHTLGFLHEETRNDRDQYVEIKWDNIAPRHKDSFRRQSRMDTLELPYDFDSVMHLPRKAFSRNGKDTVVPKEPYEGRTFGNKQALSPIDVKRINNLYQCPASAAA